MPFVGAPAAACMTPTLRKLPPRHRKNAKKNKKPAASACAVKPTATGTSASATSSSQKITCPPAKGELDLVGYDGETLEFVEIRTRTVPDDSSALPALPELSVTHSKQAVLIRTARRFLSDRRLRDCPTRFDVLAIDNILGQSPVVRLHKDAVSPQLHR